jgi:hypothetical protein
MQLTLNYENMDSPKGKPIGNKKCLEQFDKFNQVGLWSKKYAKLLISQDWFSMTCKLTWKLRSTKLHRFYFHLNTKKEGIMLPTPTSSDMNNANMTAAAKLMKGAKRRASGQRIQKSLTMAIHQVILNGNPNLADELARNQILKRENLPTQEEFTNWIGTITNAKELSEKTKIKLTKVEHWFRIDKSGFSYPTIKEWEIIKPILNPTQEMDKMMTTTTSKQWIGMLPTPRSRDYKGYRKLTNGKNMTPNGEEMGLTLEQVARIMTNTQEATSKNSHLSPLFVMEMMGFPTDWTLVPFLKK